MGRLPRPIADGLVYHALNRGNNREAVFSADADFAAFLHALRQTRQRYPFRLYGYCLMSNHFHLLLQPESEQNISRILQSLTVAHTWRFHKAHGSVGHVWQGRFKSPVIQDDDHLLTVLRYIESNPMRAGLVSDVQQYPWCSYPVHGLGQGDELVTQLPGWHTLGQTERARQARWRRFVHTPLTERELAAVRRAVTSGRPFGSPGWVEATARSLGLALMPRPRGRPRKQTEK
ncbi:MAG TPA: transposase [Gemmataceae bacterium]|nr:transposase [Gemmataceae bacterium]